MTSPAADSGLAQRLAFAMMVKKARGMEKDGT